MFVREMHIEVNQGYQSIAANRRRKLLSEEIDWILNKVQDRYIENNTSRKNGFEVDQLSLDKIRTLVVPSKEQPVYYENGICYAILPPAYRHLVSDESKVLVTKTRTTASEAITLTKIVVPFSPKVSAPYYSTVNLYIGGTLAFDLTANALSKGKTYTGLSSKEEHFTVAGELYQALYRLGKNVYWERYGDQYFPNTLLIATVGTTPAYRLVVDTSDVTAPTVPLNKTKFSTEDGAWKTNRLYTNTFASLQISTAFHSTYPEAPVSQLAMDKLYIHVNSNFIVSKSRLTYVRIPRKINLTLGQDCELPENSHPDICDLSVEYIKKMLDDPNWEIKLQDNIQRTTI